MDGRHGVALFRLPSMVTKRDTEPPLSSWGIGLIVMGVLPLGLFLYAAILSKLLPSSGIYVLDVLQNDSYVAKYLKLPVTLYYNLLVPLTIPTLVVAVYLHWLSMKLFKHA